MQILGLWGKDRSNNIHPMNGFPHGFAFNGFDLSQDGSDGSNFNLMKESNLNLTLRLQKPAEGSTTIFCYIEFKTILDIDRDHNIFTIIDTHQIRKILNSHPRTRNIFVSVHVANEFSENHDSVNRMHIFAVLVMQQVQENTGCVSSSLAKTLVNTMVRMDLHRPNKLHVF